MNGIRSSILLGHKTCTIWTPPGDGPWPTVYLCSGDLADRLNELTQDHPSLLLVSVPGDWERDYSPWPAPPLEGHAAFMGKAPEHLRYLLETVKPEIDARYPVNPGNSALLGYSLGGLFALWSLYQTDAFQLFGSLSGSFWYDGWEQFIRRYPPVSSAQVYLSLGKTEERTGNPRMRTVGERTWQTYALLKEQLGSDRISLEWNRGGHFTGILTRWHKALSWCENRLEVSCQNR